jgi:hypothetical protein
MKPSPGTITHRLHGVCPGRVVILTQPLDAGASYRREDEPMSHLARSRHYPEIVREIKTRYGAPALGPCHLTTTEAALAEARRERQLATQL